MQKQRVSWIDVARGIGIFLVVYGHSLSAHSHRYLIYSFHMPLFFFLSGLVFSYRPEHTKRAVFLKNVRGLLYPYFLFAVLSFLLWVATRHPSISEQVWQFLSIFYGNGNNNLLTFNNLLWFLPCLFITRIGFYALRSITGDRKYLMAVLFIISLLGYGYSVFLSNWKLFFGIETALTAIVFFGAGFLWKTAGENEKKRFSAHVWQVLLIAIVVCILFAVLNFQEYSSQVDLRVDRLNNYFYFYLAAFAGITATVSLSQLIRQNRVLEYMGKNSLVIFAWHLLLFHYLSPVFRFTGISQLFSSLPKFFSPLLYSFTAIGIILGTSRIVTYASQRVFRKDS